MVPMTPGSVDRLVSGLKLAFQKRLIHVPPSAVDLVSQLESLRAAEAGRNRDLIRLAPSGRGPDPTRHDDLAVALALCVDSVRLTLGRPVLPAQSACMRPNPPRCFLFGRNQWDGGDGADCRELCPTFRVVRLAWQAAGRPGDLRTWAHDQDFEPNGMITRTALARFQSCPTNYV